MTIDETLQEDIRATAARVLLEDIGTGDVTADLIPADAIIDATLITRETMTMAGRPWVDEIFHQLDANIALQWPVNDGDSVAAGTIICRLQGPARAVLSGERAALNILQTLSATATLTSEYVRAVADTDCQILDTRKTLPGLRRAQKYAVRCGGGCNHRMGLFDAILIKENHIMSAGSIGAAIGAARQLHPDLSIEIEVESLAEMREALAENVERLLLDNFSSELLAGAVAMNQAEGNPPAELEASGGMTINEVAAVARTGVDYISVGAITKNIRAVDLSMRFTTS
ncbi:MAG: carboxylating nicotinate-nucleotide diphosphorylase [Gammaproteobacteria bacterium]|nr:carboxylating nicotinate-nucleotide diphosphorylase [Gammaproteobacteria bacterium]